MRSPSRDLLWFHENAGLVLSDLDHSPNGEPPRSYWDTSEVHGAALGYADLYVRGEFNRRRFDSDNYLVRCLMASGWYGPIYMLEPHKYEFITRVGHFLDSQDSDQTLRRHSPTTSDEFVRVALGKSVDSIARPNQIDKVIKEESVRADARFKAIQSLGTFEERISIWRKMHLLELNYDGRFDYNRIIESEKFDRLREVLDVERPDTPINNFTDAAALCLLQEEVEKSISQNLPIPILFDSRGKVYRAAESFQPDGFLTYKDKNGKIVSVIRNASYFLLRASVWIPDRFSGGIRDEERLLELRQMWELTDKYVEVGSRLNMLQPDNSINIEPKLAEKIEQLRRLWFLDRVWLPFAINPTTIQFATPFLDEEQRVLSSAKELVANEAYRKTIKRDVEELRKRFESGAAKYAQFSRIWMRIHEAVETFVDHFGYLAELKPASLVNIFGLVRFGLPDTVEHTAEDYLWWLIGPDEIRRRALNEIAALCFEVVREDVTHKTAPDWLFVLLWVLEDGTTLDELLGKRFKNGLDIPPWLEILHGASLLREGANLARVKRIMSGLERRLDSVRESETRSQIMIGLAYLSFHLWENQDRTRLWSVRSFLTENVMESGGADDFRIREALDWALKARGQVRVESERYVYALNLFVYYATEGADESEFSKVEAHAIELLGFRENRATWQYRFSDTLARFYHRRALGRTGAIRRGLLELALQCIDEACREGRGDLKVLTYQRQLHLTYDGLGSDEPNMG